MSVTFTLPNIGLQSKMKCLLQSMGPNNQNAQMRLFTNSINPSDTDNHANYTEASYTGYTNQNMPTGTVTGGTLATTATLAFNPVTFALGATIAPVSIWGAFVTNDIDNELMFAVRLPSSPQIISQPGDSIICQLTITDQRAAGQP